MRRARRAAALAGLAALAGCSAEPAGYDAPAAVVHDEVADVYLVANVNGAQLAKDGNGYIARVAPDLAGMERRWIAGGRGGVTLHAPKGLALHGDTLWVADIDVLRRFDRATGAPRGEVAIPGATDLVGCAVAPDGTVWCCDRGLGPDGAPTGTDAIWRIGRSGRPVAVARGAALGQPAGLVARDVGVYVVGHGDGAFYQLDGAGRRTDLGAAPQAGLDGLARLDGAGYFTASRTGGCVYRFGLTGGVDALAADLAGPAGVGADARRGRLLVPLGAADALAVVPVGAR